MAVDLDNVRAALLPGLRDLNMRIYSATGYYSATYTTIGTSTALSGQLPIISEYQQGYSAGYSAGMLAAQAQNGANPYQSGIADPRSDAQNPGLIPINGGIIGDTFPELDLGPVLVRSDDTHYRFQRLPPLEARVLDLD